MMNFNEMFTKNFTYGIIKSHRKSRLYPVSRKHNLGKAAAVGEGVGQIDALQTF